MSANPYLTAVELMSTAFDTDNKPLEMFNKTSYKPYFEQFYARMLPAFDAIETLYEQVGEPEEMLGNMAQTLTDSAKAAVDACPKKGARDALAMNMNMQLAVLVYPAVLHYKGKSSRPLADLIGQRWKEAFPKSNVQAAEYEYIEKGFHRRFCYITTAVCENLHKGDDCYELTLLRDYRDEYLMQLPEGEDLVRSYYDVAPTIVKHISARPDASAIYSGIYEAYLAPCIHMIERGEKEQCAKHYMEMVADLKNQYFTS